jgi:hypothetical protein
MKGKMQKFLSSLSAFTKELRKNHNNKKTCEDILSTGLH